MTLTLFLSDEEYLRCSHDPSIVAQKADAYIRELYNQLETARSQFDASSITAEQTCSLIEQKYVSLKSEFETLQSQHLQLSSTLDERVSELAQLQAEKHQIDLRRIDKDWEIERLSLEASELQKSKRKLVELMEHKDLEINEKDARVKGYLDKIVTLTESDTMRESRINELEAELVRSSASCARLSQEKEIVERHNVWLDDELTAKVNSLLELRKVHNELEADRSFKLTDLERKYNHNSNSLKWKEARVKELEAKLESLQEELCSSKDAAAATEGRFSAELSTVNKLVELYKDSSEEWSKKAGELEGAIKALETHASQVQKDYEERLEKETSSRFVAEKEVSCLKEKLEKCEAELEACKKSDQLNLLQMSSFDAKVYGSPVDADDMDGDNMVLVPSIPAGISGTALASSLLRDGWNLVKMYEKYQEAIDALRHEQLGRKQSQSILERVLHEIEEKAEAIMDERADHDRMVEAYDELNERLQYSLSEQTALEKTIQELKAELRRHERDYALAQKESSDLQKEVTILLKECRDMQLRCGYVDHDNASEGMKSAVDSVNLDTDDVIPEQLLTFKDIKGLVEQNVQLRSSVRLLSEQIETREMELKENYGNEFKEQLNEAASKVDAVLARAEEQARVIESLHTSVAMYKKLYEEGHKLDLSNPQYQETAAADGRNNNKLSLEDSHDALKRAHEQAKERLKLLEEEVMGSRGKIVELQAQRDKLKVEEHFAQEKLDRFMKEFEHQREETNGVITRNIELSQSIVDYQRKIRETSETLHVAEDLSRKLSMEVSVLKREKEILSTSEKRACEEVRSLSERVHRLQASLDSIQSAEEVREEARSAHRRSQEDYVKRIEIEQAEAKKELQEVRDNVHKITVEHNISMKGAMQQIEVMGKELANALHAVAEANTRASVAEARCSDLEKIRLSGIKNSEINDDSAPTLFNNDVMADLRAAKEEIEKLREEAQVNKDHMLQYKSVAQVNEDTLKQMEVSHENFKLEAEKVKKLLEDELVSLKKQAKQLQNDNAFKANEVASAAASQEEALASSLSEIASLREECTAKLLRIEALESQMSAMKDDLDKEHQRWRNAQDNYERQVILQSETIQELTKTSQALASLQAEASELWRVSDCLRIENKDLRGKWETEKLVLEEAKDGAEKKYNEINNQNKILHSQLEALHIKWAEKDHAYGAQSSASGDQDSFDDSGLQNFVKHLRRSKEIAETEISLLKQEKLRLQSQLEGALNAETTAQGSLRAERESSRSLHFTEDEFKALQLQVREVNLLRESNIQLREENRHNFEECQKLRQSDQNARIQVENLESLLGERKNEVDALKRELEMHKEKRKDLEKRVNELPERLNIIDPENYDRMRADIQQMQVNLIDKDGHLEEIKKLVSEKQEIILQLEQDLARRKVEADERELRISAVIQVEASLKSDVDRHKRLNVQLKRRCDNLLKEREELTKKNQELSKELVESNQGRKSNVDTMDEQAIKEREDQNTRIQMLEKMVDKQRDESREREEKDARIQMLEKVVEGLRDEVKKGKDEDKIKKAKNQKTEKEIGDSQRNLKLADDLEKHKQVLKTLLDKVEKLRPATEPEGTSVVPPLSSDSFDDVAAACLLAVANFEQLSRQVSGDITVPAPADTSAEAASSLSASANESGKTLVSPKPKDEPRKAGRRLVRPRFVKSDQPKGDVDMLETVGADAQPSSHKRPSVLSTSEGHEGTLVHESSNSDVAAPLLKKPRGSEQPQEGAQIEHIDVHFQTSEGLPSTSKIVNVGDEIQNLNEKTVDSERDEKVDNGEELGVEDQAELQNDRSDTVDESLNRPGETDVSKDQLKVIEAEEEQIKQVTPKASNEPEEGYAIVSSKETGDAQPAEHLPRSPSPMPIDDYVMEDTLGDMEVGSPLSGLEENEEGEIEVDETTPESPTCKLNDDGNDGTGAMAEETATVDAVMVAPVAEKTSDASVIPETGVSNPEDSTRRSALTSEPTDIKQEEPVADTNLTTINLEDSTHRSVLSSEPTDVKQEEPVADTNSTTINLNERARQRSLQRLAGTISPPPVTRSRGRAPRGRGRGGRAGRGGPTHGPQG